MKSRQAAGSPDSIGAETVDDPLNQVFENRLPAVWRMPGGTFERLEQFRPAGLLPGSFNPLHDGHRALREQAERELDGQVAYELAVRNADKPTIDRDTVLDRCLRISDAPVLISNCATFVQKSEIVPQCVYIIGADTAVRVIDPRFYGDCHESMLGALRSVRQNACRFLVACRLVDDRLLTRCDLGLPPEFDDLFQELPPAHFRMDVSSTALRDNPGPTSTAQQECLPLFVFGTLRRGQCNHHLLAGRYSRALPASLPDYGHVQALMIARRPGQTVQGELYRLRESSYDRTMRDCDDLEGIPPGSTVGPWYERVAVTVETADGPVEAWAYVRPQRDE